MTYACNTCGIFVEVGDEAKNVTFSHKCPGGATSRIPFWFLVSWLCFAGTSFFDLLQRVLK